MDNDSLDSFTSYRPYADVGERLVAAMHAKRIKGSELAVLLRRVDDPHDRLTPQAVSKWTTGKGLPEEDRMERLTQLLGVSREFLLGDHKPPKPGRKPVLQRAENVDRVANSDVGVLAWDETQRSFDGEAHVIAATLRNRAAIAPRMPILTYNVMMSDFRKALPPEFRVNCGKMAPGPFERQYYSDYFSEYLEAEIIPVKGAIAGKNVASVVLEMLMQHHRIYEIRRYAVIIISDTDRSKASPTVEDACKLWGIGLHRVDSPAAAAELVVEFEKSIRAESMADPIE